MAAVSGWLETLWIASSQLLKRFQLRLGTRCFQSDPVTFLCVFEGPVRNWYLKNEDIGFLVHVKFGEKGNLSKKGSEMVNKVPQTEDPAGVNSKTW